MIASKTRICGAVLTLLFMAGCTPAAKDAGFGSVQQTVRDRTGYQVQWDRGTQADQMAAQSIRSLLRQELTADAAVQVALLNNRNLQATYEELGIAQAELVEAGLLRNPMLTAEVRFPKYHALPFEFDVTQSFLDLLVLPLRKRAAGVAFEAAKQRVTHEVLTTVADVKVAFYHAQGAAQLLDLRRNITSATQASYDAATRMHDAGNIPDLALANERVLHERATVDLAKAERDALDAREELSALMGVWGDDTGWTLAARLPDLPESEENLSGLESLAVTRRADLAAARQEFERNLQNLGLSRYTALGDVTLGGHLEKDSDGDLTAGPALTLPLPIFNQGQPAIAAAEARLRQSRQRFAVVAVQARAQVRRAANRLTAARDIAQYLGKVVIPLRHQIVQQNQLQFNAMQIGVFELLQAKQSEIDAGRDYVEALQDYWVARAQLERAIGGRLPGEAPPTTQPAPAAPVPQSPPPADSHQHHHH
jgi:outer membrane protein, heavy metal efflux system